MFSRMFGKGKPTEDGKEKDLAHLHIPPIPEPSISTDYTKTMRTKTLQENPKEGKETLNVAKFREIITSELELAKKDFADDKLFLAANRVGKLRLFVESLAAGKADAENRDTNKDVEGGEDYEKLAEQIQKAWAEVAEKDETYQAIIAAEKRARKFLRLLENDEGWNLSHEGTRLVSHWKAEKDTDTYSFRVAGVVDACVLNIIPLLLETDLYPTWFPLMKSAEELASPSRFHKVVKSMLKMPFPLLGREAMIDGRGWDVMEHNRVVSASMKMKTNPQTQNQQSTPKPLS